MDPYPYANSDRMVHLVAKNKAGEDHWFGLTGPQYQLYRKAQAVESAVAEDQWNLTTTGGDLPEDVSAVYFTGSGFNHFGVPALLGRPLIPADAPEGQDPQPVAVLGYKFWQRHYPGDRDVVGITIQLLHKRYTKEFSRVCSCDRAGEGRSDRPGNRKLEIPSLMTPIGFLKSEDTSDDSRNFFACVRRVSTRRFEVL
jgi:hypothetical protein